jgi:hypothetical protein
MNETDQHSFELLEKKNLNSSSSSSLLQNTFLLERPYRFYRKEIEKLSF